MSFDDVGYEVVRNIISEDACKILESEFTLNEYLRKHHNFPESILGGNWDDGQVNAGSFAKYSHLPFEALSVFLLPKFEEIIGKRLAPTYTYARIYKTGAVLEKHKDRPECEYSATLTLSKGLDWPIYMDGTPIELNVGDAAVYKGEQVEHWRDAYDGKSQVQVFLHYVDFDGPYKDNIWDTRPFLGYPESGKENGG